MKPPSTHQSKNALAAFAWPLCVVICIVFLAIFFREQISTLISKTQKGNISISGKGFQFGFEQDLSFQTAQVDNLQADVSYIVEQAAKSKDKAVVLAWNLLNKNIRRTMAVTNWNNGQFVDAETSINVLIELGVVARNVASSVHALQLARDRVVETQQPAARNENESAIISGIQALRAIYAISSQQNIVAYTSVKIYSDDKCTTSIENSYGVILKTFQVEGLGVDSEYRIYPTTRTDYFKGERLTWKWISSPVFGKTWYRDPDTNEIKLAWDSSMTFVGGNIDNIE